MAKSERLLFGIEYAWGREISVFAENQTDAIQQVKTTVKDKWDSCGKISILPPLITGDDSWTFNQWEEERQRILKQLGRVG